MDEELLKELMNTVCWHDCWDDCWAICLVKHWAVRKANKKSIVRDKPYLGKHLKTVTQPRQNQGLISRLAPSKERKHRNWKESGLRGYISWSTELITLGEGEEPCHDISICSSICCFKPHFILSTQKQATEHHRRKAVLGCSLVLSSGLKQMSRQEDKLRGMTIALRKVPVDDGLWHRDFLR